MEKLTIQEEEVMLHIWSMGECFVKDIVAKFPEPKPPYTTVASIVNNLKRKGYVTAKRFGNTYQYTPVVKHEGGNLAASKIRNLECPSYEICLIDYGCGKFNRKIHIMEQYP